MSATKISPHLLSFVQNQLSLIEFDLTTQGPLRSGTYRAARTRFRYGPFTVWTVTFLGDAHGKAHARDVGRVFLGGPTPFGEPFAPGGGLFLEPTLAHDARAAVLQEIATALHARLANVDRGRDLAAAPATGE